MLLQLLDWSAVSLLERDKEIYNHGVLMTLAIKIKLSSCLGPCRTLNFVVYFIPVIIYGHLVARFRHNFQLIVLYFTHYAFEYLYKIIMLYGKVKFNT